MSNKIKLTIGGNDYYITSEDSVEYMNSLASELEEKMQNMIESSAFLSTTMAAVLTALEYCDRCHKAEKSETDVTDKMSTFSDANTKAQAEITKAYREIERLNRENKELRDRLKKC